MKDIAEIIERLSESIVFAEPDNPDSVEEIDLQLREVLAWADSNKRTELIETTISAIDLFSEITNSPNDIAEKILSAIARYISDLSCLICDDRRPDEVNFPRKVSIDSQPLVRTELSGTIQEPTEKSTTAAKGASTLSTPAATDGNNQSIGENASERPLEALNASQSSDRTASSNDEINPILDDPELIDSFISEASEHVESLEGNLLLLEKSPENLDALNDVFRCFHFIKGVSSCLSLKDIEALSHATENLLETIRNKTITLNAALMEILFDACDILRELFAALEAAHQSKSRLKPRPGLSDFIVLINQAASGASVRSVSTGNGSDAFGLVRDSIRIDSDRLNLLVETIGELVVVESMVKQSVSGGSVAGGDAYRHLNHLDKITRTLQQLATTLRMVPLRSTFQRMNRVVRDLVAKSGKSVNLTIRGEDTELDKSVVDQIGEPLLHLMRNCIDHGIEPDSATRRAVGKESTGEIRLEAYHKGGNIFIEISDDGRGINRETVIIKAISRGIITDGADLTDEDVHDILCLPGFTTMDNATTVSGRGVGMDVVKRSIDALRGKLSIESEPGHGTKFTIRLPLTLAIIDGMVVRIGSEKYILPVLSIYQSLRPAPGDVSRIIGYGDMLSYQDSSIPVFFLGELFKIENAVNRAEDAIIVIITESDRWVGVVVDEIIGQQQIVIKSLEGDFRNIPGIAGGAIMPDGSVGLILDTGALVQMARRTPTIVGRRANNDEA